MTEARKTSCNQAAAAADLQSDTVICPNCVHQFRAIPADVQAELQALREEMVVVRGANASLRLSLHGCDAEVKRLEAEADQRSSREAVLEEAANEIPTNWCDPLLTGPNAVLKPEAGRWDCHDIARLLTALAARIRARKDKNDALPVSNDAQDAARYRYLRRCYYWDCSVGEHAALMHVAEEAKLDAAIDEALTEERESRIKLGKAIVEGAQAASPDAGEGEK